MNEQIASRQILRSLAALFAGAGVSIVLAISTDAALFASGVFPKGGAPMTDSLLALATVYRNVYGILGSYITARLAPSRPMAHSVALGVVGVVLSALLAIGTWNKGPAIGHDWYLLAPIVLGLPCAWAGGKLREWRLQPRAAV